MDRDIFSRLKGSKTLRLSKSDAADASIISKVVPIMVNGSEKNFVIPNITVKVWPKLLAHEKQSNM